MKVYYALISILVFTACGGGSGECTDLHTGTFSTTSEEGYVTLITREGNTQTEIYTNGLGEETESTFGVEWISDCEYLLYDLDVDDEDYGSGLAGDTLKVTIKNIEEDHYQSHGEFLQRGWEAEMRVDIE